MTITHVRYGNPGFLRFDYAGKTLSIREPLDIIVVGMPGAGAWIAEHYGFLLSSQQEADHTLPLRR